MDIEDVMGVRSFLAASEIQSASRSFADRVWNALKILFTDLLPANITCVIPNALTWAYRSLCARSISSYTLETRDAETLRTASLFVHGKVHPRPSGDLPALLLLHGEHSHPVTLLHLADIAKAEGRAVFSVHLPYDDAHPERHQALLKRSIDKIDQLIAQKGGRLSHLLLAGHSRGAMVAAHEAYVENNLKVDGVIAIAGRFKVIHPSSRPCRPSLEESVNGLWEKLRHLSLNLRVPFYQICATKDWCMDPEASVVRTDQGHLFVDASHLGVIKHPQTLQQFRSWVSAS